MTAEVWIDALPPGSHGPVLQWTRHEDQRARLMVDLVRSWSTSHIIAEALQLAHDQKVSRATIDAIVYAAADMSEATYDEIKRRGWQLVLEKKEVAA